MRAILLFLGGVLVFVTPSSAADRNGEFFTRGLGVESCESYLADKAGNTGRYLFFRSWVNGYLSAYNQMAPQTYDVAPNATVDGLANALQEICQANPKEQFWTAVFALTKTLEPQRLTARPELVTATAGDRSITIDRPAMRRIQQALTELGYEVGLVDGLYGGNTRKALEAYQRDQQLAVTGLPDGPTRAKLLR